MTENEAIKIIKYYYPKKKKFNCGIFTEVHDTECNFGQALNVAIAALEEVQQYREIGTVEKYREAMEKDRWISVEKKTPEVGEYVLGTNKYGEVLIYKYTWNCPHTKEMFFHLCGTAATITAWMPLPEPYRPEGSGKYE